TKYSCDGSPDRFSSGSTASDLIGEGADILVNKNHIPIPITPMTPTERTATSFLEIRLLDTGNGVEIDRPFSDPFALEAAGLIVTISLSCSGTSEKANRVSATNRYPRPGIVKINLCCFEFSPSAFRKTAMFWTR